ncbi:MAG: flagellin FliC [Polyangiaceae bacterium]|nr:flagellin FliC [Myxococcales bacterium]MCB9587277.1 flagellin FliC [Polyangiaceae bacterium]MCB9605926.1 flagellin FliC [Polyangiaceae bacterium]
MSLVVRTNVASLQSQMNLGKNQAALSTSFNKLSSGYRVNSAADDAAGLSISENIVGQVRSYTVAERNANDAISMVQTAEASLGEMTGIMQRMRELAVQGANGNYTAQDRGYMDTEFQALKSELSRIQAAAKFNGKQLVGTAATTITFQIGLDNTASDQMAISFGGMNLTAMLAATSTLSGTGPTASQNMLARIDSTMTAISTARADYGASMNRLDIATSAIQTMRLNMSAANSRIRDVDVAMETSTMARNQVLSQAGVSVLSQANQLTQSALNLLQ